MFLMIQQHCKDYYEDTNWNEALPIWIFQNGMFCSRNSTSIQQKEDLSTSHLTFADKQQLEYMYSQVNQLALPVLPTEVIRGLLEAHNVVQWQTMGVPTSPSTNNLWSAAASSCYYLSGSHVDNGFLTQVALSFATMIVMLLKVTEH
jgi:hypothetical protein